MESQILDLSSQMNTVLAPMDVICQCKAEQASTSAADTKAGPASPAKPASMPKPVDKGIALENPILSLSEAE